MEVKIINIDPKPGVRILTSRELKTIKAYNLAQKVEAAVHRAWEQSAKPLVEPLFLSYAKQILLWFFLWIFPVVFFIHYYDPTNRKIAGIENLLFVFFVFLIILFVVVMFLGMIILVAAHTKKDEEEKNRMIFSKANLDIWKGARGFKKINSTLWWLGSLVILAWVGYVLLAIAFVIVYIIIKLCTLIIKAGIQDRMDEILEIKKKATTA